MHLIGLSLGQVLAVFAAFGLGVLILYLLKLRRRQIVVPFVHLWRQVLAERQSTRLLSQLKRWLSFLLALSIVGALALALGDPRFAAANEEGRNIVLLIDASASMQARDAEGSRADVAKKRAFRLIEELGASDRMLIAQLDDSATPLTPLTDDPRLLREALDAVESTELEANLHAGLNLAIDVLQGLSRAEVVVLSDGLLRDPDEAEERLQRAGVRLSWLPIGRGGRNIGITAFAVRRYPLDKSQSEVLVELWNPGEADEQIELSLLGDGEVVDMQRLIVGAGERLRRFFGQISGVDSRLEARVKLADGSADALPADDRAYARLPERRRARVLVVSDGNLYLQAALLLDEYLEVTETTPDAYPVDEHFDVTIFDRCLPDRQPKGAALYLYPEPVENRWAPFAVEGILEHPYFDEMKRRHPLLQWTALGDVNIADALIVRPEQGDRVVAGDPKAPLLIEGRRGDHRFVALTFDPRRSDLPLRVAWPLFLLNTIELFVQEDVGYVSSVRTGDTWRLPVPEQAKKVTILDPTGGRREVPVSGGQAVYAGKRAGFYTLEADGVSSVIAANLVSDLESRIEPPKELKVGTIEAGAMSAGALGVRREIWIYLVWIVLAVLLLEWWSYHRRWTV